MTATLNISEIRIDGKTQSRVEMNNDVIAEYAAAIQDGAEFPPITVFFDGSSYWLADGFHRLWAHKRAEKNLIKAEVIRGTQRDAILYSVSANASHGLRRSNADKRKAVMTLLEDAEWGSQTDQWIATRCGVGRMFVSKLRKDIFESTGVESEPVKRLVTRNGKTYEMNVANIGSTTPKSRPLTEEELSITSLVASGECVYLLATNDRVKVGWTRHGARGRIEQLLTSTPLATVVAVSSGTRAQEQRVHKILECERDAGEWFVCSPQDAIDAMKEAGLRPLPESGGDIMHSDGKIDSARTAEEAPQPEAPAVDEEKEALRKALAQAQELNSELAMDLEAAEINTSENKESEVRIAIQRLNTERSQKEMYMTKCNELIKQNRMLTNALNRKEKEIAELKKFIAENKIGEIDAAL